jgi:hypothetical protein
MGAKKTNAIAKERYFCKTGKDPVKIQIQFHAWHLSSCSFLQTSLSLL